jgi:secreted effector protein SseC
MAIALERTIYGANAPGTWLKNDSVTKSSQTDNSVPLSSGLLVPPIVASRARPSELAAPKNMEAQASRQETAKALERLMQSLPKSQSSEPQLKLDLSTIERMPMESMFFASTLLTNQILGDVAAKKGEALEIMSRKQDSLRQKEVESIREQMAKSVEQQDKAKKAGVFSVVFDWVIAAVEIVTGVAKMVGAAMTGNVMQLAGGAMDFMAGMAGLVKAVANTMALVDPDNAEKYHKIAEKAGIVQMSFEIAGAAIDITSAVRNALVTKMVPKVAGKVLKEGAAQELKTAIKAGCQSELSTLANQIGKKVAAEAGQQIANQLGQQAMQQVSNNVLKKVVQQFGVNKMMEAFSQQAIEKMVTEAVKKVGTQAIRRGSELTAEQITKRVVAEIRKSVVSALKNALVVNANVLMNVTRQSVVGAQNITVGMIDKEKALLQKQIDQLVLDQQWVQGFFQFFEQNKKEGIKKVRELQESQASVMQAGTQMISHIAANQAQMAASMV